MGRRKLAKAHPAPQPWNKWALRVGAPVLVAALAVAVALAAAKSIVNKTQTKNDKDTHPYSFCFPLQIEQTPFRDQPKHQKRCPVIIRNHAVDMLATKLKAWTDWDYMQKRLLENKKLRFDASPTPLFTYWDEKVSPLAALVKQQVPENSRHRKVDSSGEEFMTALLQGGESSPYGYVRASLPAELFAPKIRKTIEKFLQMYHNWIMPPGREPGALVWVSAEGVASTPHYDMWDNAYVVLGGTKRLLLGSPELAQQIGQYPINHPQQRQLFSRSLDCSSGLTSAELNCSSGRLDPRVHDVDLEPGDAIYIPSGWVHEFVSTTKSFAVAFINKDPEVDDVSTILGDVMKFLDMLKAQWSQSRTLAILPSYLHALTSEAGENFETIIENYIIKPIDSKVRAHFGLRSTSAFSCPQTKAEDAGVAVAAAKSVGRKFLGMRTDTRKIYLMEVIFQTLIWVFKPEEIPTTRDQADRALQETIALHLDFTMACLMNNTL